MTVRQKARLGVGGTHAAAVGRVVYDRYWTRELRSAACCAVLHLGMLMLLDLELVRLTGGPLLAVLLLIIVTPPRVSTENGVLEARGLPTYHRVRTNRLAAARMSEGAHSGWY